MKNVAGGMKKEKKRREDEKGYSGTPRKIEKNGSRF